MWRESPAIPRLWLHSRPENPKDDVMAKAIGGGLRAWAANNYRSSADNRPKASRRRQRLPTRQTLNSGRLSSTMPTSNAEASRCVTTARSRLAKKGKRRSISGFPYYLPWVFVIS
jgi:hypothetical protein